MFAIVAFALGPNGAPMLSELAVQHCLGCHVRNVAVARMDGFKDVQRRIGNSFLTSSETKLNSLYFGNQSREYQIAPSGNDGESSGFVRNVRNVAVCSQLLTR